VDQQHRWVFLARLPLRRLEDESLNAVTTRALEPEILYRIDGEAGDEGIVLMRELVRNGPSRFDRRRENFGGMICRVTSLPILRSSDITETT